MVMKGYSAFPKAPALLEPPHQIVWCHILDTRLVEMEVLTPLQRSSRCILFYTQPTGQVTIMIFFMIEAWMDLYILGDFLKYPILVAQFVVISFSGDSRSVVADLLDSDIEVSSNSCRTMTFTFRQITLGKAWTPLSPPPTNGFESLIRCISSRMALALNNPQRLMCH